MTDIDHTIQGNFSQSVEIETESESWLFTAGTRFTLRGYSAAISELETSIGNTITVENARIEARWGLYLRGSDTIARIEDGRIDATVGIVMMGSNQHVENYAAIRSSDGSGISVGDDYGGDSTLINHGKLTGWVGIYNSSQGSEIINFGTIRVSGVGIDMQEDTSLNLMKGSRVIAKDTAIHIDALHDGAVDIVNRGYVEGGKRAVSIEDAPVTFINSGTIVGDVFLGFKSDVFDNSRGELEGVLEGRGGADRLIAGRGGQIIYGGAGDDHVISGRGNDVFTGDAGADTFVFGRSNGRDTVRDFGSDDSLEFDDVPQIENFTDFIRNHASDAANGLMIAYGGQRILLAGVTTDDIDADQVVFG